MPKTISFWDHPISTIEKALHIRKQIEALKSALAEVMTRGGGFSIATAPKRRGRPAKIAVAPSITAGKTDGRKGKRSAATIAKMKAAAKARWAAKKNGNSAPAATTAAKALKKKRTMSPETKAKMAAAQKARWAKMKG